MHFEITKIEAQRCVYMCERENCSGTSQSRIEGVGSWVDGCLGGPVGVLTRSAVPARR